MIYIIIFVVLYSLLVIWIFMMMNELEKSNGKEPLTLKSIYKYFNKQRQKAL